MSIAAVDDMETLVAWYEAKYRDQGEFASLYLSSFDVTINKTFTADTAPRLAICFEELESFDSIVLTDLIEILSTYSKRLPLVLLLAISTSISAIHTLLPRSTSELLRIATFTVTPNIETFHSLVFETLIKRSQAINLSSKVFGFLRDSFLDLNQSVDGVISKLQVSNLLQRTPLSVKANLAILINSICILHTSSAVLYQSYAILCQTIWK